MLDFSSGKSEKHDKTVDVDSFVMLSYNETGYINGRQTA